MRSRKRIFASKAAADLETIAEDLARKDPARAVAFIEEIEAGCRRIAETPASDFEAVSDALAPGLRIAFVGPRSILFRVASGVVRIERILPAAPPDDEPG